MLKELSSFFLLTTLLVGCTTELKTYPDRRTESERDASPGLPYALPMLQYELTLTRRLTQCEGEMLEYDPDGNPIFDDDTKDGTLSNPDGNLEQRKVAEIVFSLSAEAKPTYIAGETYNIDVPALAARSKTSTLKMEFHEDSGTLKSINAAADDQSADIIKDTVSSLIGIASIFIGVPLPGSDALSDDEPPRCKPETKDKIRSLKTQSPSVKLATAALKSATDALNAAIEGISPLSSISALSEEKKRELSDLATTQRERFRDLTAEKQALEKTKKSLSQINTVAWPTTFTELESTKAHPFGLSPVEKKKWGSFFWPVPTSLAGYLDKNLTMSAVIKPLIVHDTTFGEAVKVEVGSDGVGGFLFRPPSPGMLKVCKQLKDEECKGQTTDVILRSDKPISVPQLGQLRYLEFRNEAFQNNDLVVGLRPDGHLEKFEYQEKSAAAADVADVIKDATAQISSFLIDKEEKKKADKEEAEDDEKNAVKEAREELAAERADAIADIQFEIDLLETQSTLAKLREPEDTATIDAITIETAEIDARVALLNSRLAELEAQRKLENAAAEAD